MIIGTSLGLLSIGSVGVGMFDGDGRDHRATGPLEDRIKNILGDILGIVPE